MAVSRDHARFPEASILGLGTSVPQFHVDWLTSAQFAAKTSRADSQQSRRVNALYRRTGIDRRGSVLLHETPEPAHELVSTFYPPANSPEDRGPSTGSRGDRYAAEAPDLAHRASEMALRHSRTAPAEITHLVTVTCTGFVSPGIDIELIDRLGLPAATQRLQIGFMGCHGAINGLRAARGLVAAHRNARVLVCCVELCSLHFQYGLDADRVVSNALFADGGGAVVVGPAAVDSIGRLDDTGSQLVPDSRDTMTWRIGDHGYEMTLSPRVPGLIEEHLASFLTPWLAGHGESISSIGGWAVHPGGTRILSATESALGIDSDALSVSRAVLADHGNMSSATMLFVLDRFAEVSQPKPWVMLGFGPGLEIEVALIR